jgi:hypothetical protein
MANPVTDATALVNPRLKRLACRRFRGVAEENRKPQKKAGPVTGPLLQEKTAQKN